MKKARGFTMALVLTVAGASGARAQGTLTHTNGGGTATFAYGNYSAANGFPTNFTAVADNAFSQWWWFRVEGDTQETKLPLPDTQHYAANVATFTWANVAGRGFHATLTTTVTSVALGVARVEIAFRVKNNTASPLTLHVFAYSDLDANGSAAGDSVAFEDLGGGILSDEALVITDATAGSCASAASGRTPTR